MKKLLLLLLFIPLVSFGQSKKFKKDYKRILKSPGFLFMTDWRESNYGNILYNKNVLSKIISNSAKYGYKLIKRGDDGQFIFKDGIFNYIWLEKNISDLNYESFPGYSIGSVYKKFYFSKETINDAIVVKVETEIGLLEYPNVSASQIINHYEFVKNFVKRSYLERFNLESSSQKYDSKSMFDEYYDLVDIYKIWRINEPINDYKIEYVLSIGNGTKQIKNKKGSYNNYYKIVFSIESSMSYLSDLAYEKVKTQSNESYDNLRFTIGGEDIRKSNIYDLKSMVNIFLEDCKKNNITTPLITTLKATFEPLDGNTIALSYGFDNDSAIIIKVDPEKWANASKEKRWYVLYHELGHDVLNLDHGEGGKMMFNFADKEYSWDDFFEDKKYMLNFVK